MSLISGSYSLTTAAATGAEDFNGPNEEIEAAIGIGKQQVAGLNENSGIRLVLIRKFRGISREKFLERDDIWGQ